METRHAPLWETALKFGPPILRKVIDAGVPKNTVINVNFPACAPDDVAGVRVTRQGKRNLGFLKVDQRRDGRGNPYFWIGFERRRRWTRRPKALISRHWRRAMFR